MQETIPSRAVLANRHVKVSAQCPICEIGVEDTKHVLFQCKMAKLGEEGDWHFYGDWHF
jgi:hypothetical protein